MSRLPYIQPLAIVTTLLLSVATAAGQQVFVWEGVQPIPDLFPAGAVVEIVVPGDGGPLLIEDLDVDVIVDHSWQGDLVVALTHVDSGTSAVLMDRPGEPQFPNGFSQPRLGNPFTLEAFFFDDEAGMPYDAPFVPLPGITNVSGQWLPDSDPLFDFDGLDASGLWQLQVIDAGPGGTGFISKFSLHITPPCSPPTIIQQPASQVVCTGSDLTLEVQVDGTGPFFYDWCFEDLCGIFPPDSGVVALDHIQLNQGGIYSVEVSGSCGVIGSGAFEINVSDRCALEPPECPPAAPDAGCSTRGELKICALKAYAGEFTSEGVDLWIPGRGLDFAWTRRYRSRVDTGFNRFGNQWDFSYDIRLQPQGSAFLIWDGNTRKDLFVLQPDGTWGCDEVFRVLESNQDCSSPEHDNCYALTFADTSQWRFFGFDSAFVYQLESIVDRNGNTLRFDYDPLTGGLTTVTDTLDRPINMAYTADGKIASVTDWAGRQVHYAYYQDGERGGSPGDLKSVTTPAVVPAAEFTVPPGHEYPGGKTTVYTYSSGFADDRLNHNLLTITDPAGQTFLVNEYAATQDPDQLDFDHLVRQTFGDPGEVIDLVTVPQTPDVANNFAVIKAITNDRVGNVREQCFDGLNRLVLDRAFTGRADPDLPTTDTLNRPLDPLRPDDPPFFDTRYEWNADSLCTKRVLPSLNEILQTFDSEHASPRAHGNLLQRCREPGPLGGDQDAICELFEYDDGGAGCCGTNFVTRHVDGRGQQTLHEYDAAGNRTHTAHRIPTIVEDFEFNGFGQLTLHVLPDNGSRSRRNDRYTYYTPDDGPQNGYLRQQIIDPPGFALTTTYEYDTVGNITRTVDPRGHDTQQDVNQLNQVLRQRSRETAGGSGVRYERTTFYDPNDNVVRIDIENRDDSGSLVPDNPAFTTTYEYDALNNITRTVSELEPGVNQVTEYAYDANRNRTLTRHGEATNGNDPFNIVRHLYDERDLRFRETRAEGHAGQSTTQYDYDGNGNGAATRAGLEDTPRVTLWAYDGYDRLTATTDPMGNVTEFHYDPNGNIGGEVDPIGRPGVLHPFGERHLGELIDIAGPDDNVRLFETTYEYDAMDRLTRQATQFFDPVTQAPLMGGQQLGQAITETQYSDNSQVIALTNDNQHTTATLYDTANRRALVTDPAGNTRTVTYDPNDNIIVETDLEQSDLGGDNQIFTTTYEYDPLDRMTRSIDNRGNDRVLGYDSRDQVLVEVDPLDRQTRHTYDGLDRLTRTVHDLDGDGADGDGPDIVIIKIYDDSSRLIAALDDYEHPTTYEYDSLNRVTRQVHADGTAHDYGYDVHDNRNTASDANGTEMVLQYDLLDRLTARSVDRAAVADGDPVDVLGTTQETYAYDGLSRLVSAADDDSLVLLNYDSLSNTTRQTLNGLEVISVCDGVGNPRSCTYPGGRQISTTFDALERQAVIGDAAGLIAAYAYVGPQRTERIEFGNLTRCDYTYDGVSGVPDPAGDFGVRQIIATAHSRVVDGAVIDIRGYLWDPLYNKIQQQDLRDPGPQLTHDYFYDAMNRLTRTEVTDAAAATVRDTQYDLDGAGSRQQVIGMPDPGVYLRDGTLPEPGDFQTQQYTATPFDSRTYDPNGNLTARTPGAALRYDYRNQMVEYLDAAAGQRHTYAYDALGRRIATVLDADGAAEETRHYYDGRQVVEERAAGDTVRATYAYGRELDEVLTMQRDVNSDGAMEDYYYHGDDLHSVVALTRGSALADEWTDDLDGYPPGMLSGSGGWAPWDDNPAAGAFEVVVEQAHNGGQSLAIDGPDDAVRAYAGYTSGKAVYSAWQYIPSDFSSGSPDASAGTYFMLLNTYAPSGPYHWSVQMQFDSNDGLCKVLHGDGLNSIQVPYVTDRWAKIQVVVDLDHDWTQIYYDDDLVTEYPWTGGVLGSGGGVLDIAVVDLYGNGSSGVFYDDLRLQRFEDGLPGTVADRYAYGDYGTATRTHCPFDHNGSGEVNAADLAQLLGAWGPNPGHPADLNNDGVVNAADLAQLLGAWGPCQEPAPSGNPYGFTGRRYDLESGLTYYRARYLDPRVGRFTTRDPLGMWGDALNLGNAYTYVGNNPATRVDPTGLFWERIPGVRGVTWRGKGKPTYGWNWVRIRIRPGLWIRYPDYVYPPRTVVMPAAPIPRGGVVQGTKSVNTPAGTPRAPGTTPGGTPSAPAAATPPNDPATAYKKTRPIVAGAPGGLGAPRRSHVGPTQPTQPISRGSSGPALPTHPAGPTSPTAPGGPTPSTGSGGTSGGGLAAPIGPTAPPSPPGGATRPFDDPHWNDPVPSGPTRLPLGQAWEPGFGGTPE